ncbi:MAG: hypothetical protein ACSLEY_03265 [Candidatus Saccharimonadales bacterium]
MIDNKLIRPIVRLWPTRIALGVIVVILVVVAPFAAFFTSISDSYDIQSWQLESLRAGIQESTLWSDPGVTLFQRPLKIGSNINENLSAYTLMIFITLIVVTLVFHSLRFISRIAIQRGARFSNETRFKSTLLTHILFKKFGITYGQSISSGHRSWVIGAVGRSVILQTQVDNPLPSLFVDSRKNDITRREGTRISLDSSLEVVLDGTSYELCRFYLPKTDQEHVFKVLNPETVAIIVKRLELSELAIEGPTVTVVLDSQSVVEATNLQAILVSLDDLISQLQASDADTVQFDSKDTIGLISSMPTVLIPILFIAISRRIVLTVTLVLLVAYIIYTLFIPGGPTESDLMMVETLTAWIYLYFAWNRYRTRSTYWYGITRLKNQRGASL